MLSPFTFSMSVPGIINPFSRSPDPSTSDSASPTHVSADQNPPGRPWLAAQRPHPSSLPPPIPLARKRGWQPSNPEPSLAATIATSTNGYLDTHPKYCDFTVTPEPRKEDEGTVEMIADLPPAKRRRTFAGTIVSGALNAALIGTAVGITVYRLWRDRGKVPELEPPPYEQGDWVASEPEEVAPPATTVETPRNKKNRTTPSITRRSAPRHRRVRTQAKVPVSPPRLSCHSSPHSPIKSEFDQLDEGDDLEDKMDWMGGRLAQLIEDGKKALGKEVVVMSEAQEDEEDDGNGNWEEEADPSTSLGHASRSGTLRHKGRPQALGTASYTSPYLSPPPTVPPHRQQFLPAHSSHSSPALPIPGRASPNDAPDMVRSFSSFHEDESQWQSSELRESMERARAAYLRNCP